MAHADETLKTHGLSRGDSAPKRALRSAAIVSLSALGLIAQVALGNLSLAEPLSRARDASLASTLSAVAWALAVLVVVVWRRALLDRVQIAPAPAALRVGAYTLAEKIGEGGMGVVYRAHHSELERPAAIKLLSPRRGGADDRARFEREVRHTRMLTHPNTIDIYDFGRTAEGSYYYAMEYVDGFDLEALVTRDGPQAPARVAHLLAQLASALAEVHAAGLVHRDVKPANVMVCQRGDSSDVVKVLDFGLSTAVDAPGVPNPSDLQYIVGTPLYLAPEALTAPEHIDARSDLYAVGALGYFLLTGSTPFSGRSLLEVCGHHLHTVPEPPSQRLGAPLPASLERLILSCLEKSPERRPQSAMALRDALLALAAPWTEERAAAWWAQHSESTASPACHADEPACCVAEPAALAA